VSVAAATDLLSGLRLVAERPPGPGLTDFALWLRANGCSEKTIESRLNHLAHCARETPRWPLVRPMCVAAWLGRPGLAPWSRSTFYGHLRSYFSYAIENDLIGVDPMARMRRPRVPRGTPRPLTPEQVVTCWPPRNPTCTRGSSSGCTPA